MQTFIQKKNIKEKAAHGLMAKQLTQKVSVMCVQ